MVKGLGINLLSRTKMENNKVPSSIAGMHLEFFKISESSRLNEIIHLLNYFTNIAVRRKWLRNWIEWIFEALKFEITFVVAWFSISCHAVSNCHSLEKIKEYVRIICNGWMLGKLTVSCSWNVVRPEPQSLSLLHEFLERKYFKIKYLIKCN